MARKQRIRTMVPWSLIDLDKIFPDRVTSDRARAILQLMFAIRQRMKENENYAAGIDRKSGYCPIEAETIKSIVGNSYRSIIKQMQDAGIIEIKKNEETGKESFTPNKWSKLYRLTPNYRKRGPNGQKYKQEFITSPSVIRAIKRFYDKSWNRQLNYIKTKGKHYQEIAKFGDSFVIDTTSLEHDLECKIVKDNGDLIEYALRFNQKLTRYCACDEFGQRLHTHIGNLPKNLRRYLRTRNNLETDLVIADVKSSQPYFLSILFYKPELLNLIPEFLPLVNLLEKNKNKPDIHAFYQDCSNGKFYEKCYLLLGDVKKEIGEFDEEEKQILKTKLFRHIFYGSPGNYHKDEELKQERNSVEARFKLLYPNVYANITNLKRIRKNKIPLVRDSLNTNSTLNKMYTLPSCLAQRLESKIILEIIAGTMFAIEKPVFTIHDAFILEKDNLDFLYEVFNQAFIHKLDINPPTLSLVRG